LLAQSDARSVALAVLFGTYLAHTLLSALFASAQRATCVARRKCCLWLTLLRPSPTLHGPADELALLLDQLDPQADMVRRHLWLIAVLDWIRGGRRHRAILCCSVLNSLLDVLQSHPKTRARVHQFWQQLVAVCSTAAPCLQTMALLRAMPCSVSLCNVCTSNFCPSSPETQDASELFALAMPDGPGRPVDCGTARSEPATYCACRGVVCSGQSPPRTAAPPI
jgi:hypothetical protein